MYITLLFVAPPFAFVLVSLHTFSPLPFSLFPCVRLPTLSPPPPPPSLLTQVSLTNSQDG
jgi:hypothetical protein